ncbi:hypothetical protein HN51_049618 [Arachis hypogaea]|nr:Urease accessory protein F [Arachis hypogaea]
MLRRREKKPDPHCVVCEESGRVDCHQCCGKGRTNQVHLEMLPKGKWPKWRRTCGGSGLGYCSRCLGTGEHSEGCDNGPRLADSISQWSQWQLLDSLLPTGGFAHSFGLEAAVQSNLVSNPDELDINYPCLGEHRKLTPSFRALGFCVAQVGNLAQS